MQSFQNTMGAMAYIFLVSLIMTNGEKLFGKNNLLAPFVILLLFSLSAAVVGGLVFGPAVLLILKNEKSEGIKSAFYSVAWLASYTLLGICLLLLFK